MLELQLESQRVVKAASLLFKGVLIVGYVCAIPMPVLVCDGVDQRLHSLVIWALRLHEINDIKLVVYSLLCVFDWKVEPLSVIIGSVIILQDEVILIGTNLNGPPKIAWLESAFKNENWLLFSLLFLRVYWVNISKPTIRFCMLLLGQRIVGEKLLVNSIDFRSRPFVFLFGSPNDLRREVKACFLWLSSKVLRDQGRKVYKISLIKVGLIFSIIGWRVHAIIDDLVWGLITKSHPLRISLLKFFD